jgi:hypothetical protein
MKVMWRGGEDVRGGKGWGGVWLYKPMVRSMKRCDGRCLRWLCPLVEEASCVTKPQ